MQIGKGGLVEEGFVDGAVLAEVRNDGFDKRHLISTEVTHLQEVCKGFVEGGLLQTGYTTDELIVVLVAFGSRFCQSASRPFGYVAKIALSDWITNKKGGS